MKLRPYEQMIGLPKEEIDALLAPTRARTLKAQAEMELSKMDARILKLENDIQNLFTHTEVSLTGVANGLDEIALLERRKKQYIDMLADLFPPKEAEKEAA